MHDLNYDAKQCPAILMVALVILLICLRSCFPGTIPLLTLPRLRLAKAAQPLVSVTAIYLPPQVIAKLKWMHFTSSRMHFQ